MTASARGISSHERNVRRAAVLAWYEANGPDYPWRHTEDDPYAVWVSEVMLQQTQAGRVAEAFPRFLRRFPSIAALAGASRADVVRAWAGMGYHRRAVALHDAARTMMREHGCAVPRDPSTLRALPGIGPYTSAAVASIAFGVPVAAVDTNVRKVMARADFGVERQEITAAQAEAAATAWLDPARPGDWNQALMNLGHGVCRTTPRCDECPLAPVCRFRLSGRTGRPSGPGQPAFEGSMRQVRGAVVTALRAHPTMTIGGLVGATGRDEEDVVTAVTGLARDGVVGATPAALAGNPRGRVRLGGAG
jgi:A/G-specific adenine glycosylase